MKVWLTLEHRFDLNRHERIVLAVVGKASEPSAIIRPVPECPITQAEWDKATRSLLARGLVLTGDI